MRSRAARILYALLFVGVFMTVTATPADAVLGISDCKDAPAPESPGGGISGFFGSGTKATTDTDGAWADGAPKADHYGMAGLTFHTYDLGCGPDISRDPGAVVGTTMADWALEVPKMIVSASSALMDAAYHPTYLQTFNPLVRTATHTLQTSIFDKWVPVAIVIIGLMLVMYSSRVRWSSAAVTVGWGLLVLVIASAVFSYPIKAGSFADNTVADVLGSVNSGINGQGGTKDEKTGKKVDPTAASSTAITNAVLFEQWKMGTFGRSNSATADKYAKAIYTGQALTYHEAAVVRKDPNGAGKALLDKKADKWEKAAEAIKKSDPDAYQYLTGHNSAGRIAAALVALFAALCVTPFLIAGALMLIGSFLIIRLAVVFFPVIATIGVVYSMRGAVKGIGSVVAAAVINSLMFGVGTAVVVLATRILLSPDAKIPLWLALALLGVFTFIMWVAMKPIRRLTAMASPGRVFGDAAGAVGQAGRNTGSTLLGFGKAAAAAYVGNAAALATLDNDETDDEQHQPRKGRRAEEYSAPAPATATAPPPTAGDPPALASAGDRASGLPTAPASPAPSPLPSGEGTDTAATAALNTGRADPEHTPDRAHANEGDAAPFVPGSTTDPDIPEPLPAATEPEIDEETGDEVYVLFHPTTEAAGDER